MIFCLWVARMDGKVLNSVCLTSHLRKWKYRCCIN